MNQAYNWRCEGVSIVIYSGVFVSLCIWTLLRISERVWTYVTNDPVRSFIGRVSTVGGFSSSKSLTRSWVCRAQSLSTCVYIIMICLRIDSAL